MFSSSYPNDPEGYAANQRGHFGLGLLSCAVGLMLAPDGLAWVPVAVAAGYLLLVEWAWQRLTLFWDSIEDAGHVGLGAATVAMIYQHDLAWALAALAGHAGIVEYGKWRRL